MQRRGVKSLHAVVHHKQDPSDLNKNRRRWAVNVLDKKSQTLEISVQRINRPARLYNNLQFAVTFSNSVNVHVNGLSTPRQTTHVYLPPITESRTIFGKVDPSAVLHRKESFKPKAYRTNVPNKVKENAVSEVSVSHSEKIPQELNKYDKTSNKGASETCSRLIKHTSDHQPAPVMTPEPLDTIDPVDTGGHMTMMSGRVKHDAGVCDPRHQRELCSDDSAIETESEDFEGHPGGKDSDDEYYTEQRITEWVLKVNSSLFSKHNDDTKSSKPVEEQDVGTIKIIYRGDK